MPDFVYNVGKGRTAELYNRVDSNDPAASGLTIVAINTSAADAVLEDYDTLAALLGDANTAEVTNTNYARIDLTDAELAAFAPDDTNNRVDLDIPDQTWTAIAAGDAWTDLVICYNPDVGTDVDANIIPLTQHDFAVTPDGSDITAQIAAAGFYRAT